MPSPQQPGSGVPALRTDPEAIAAAADDFGHLAHQVPAAVARPRDAGQVAELMRYAAPAGLAVRARGGGHSVSGQAQCGDGVVCDIGGLDDVAEVAPERVSVGAGARWSRVLAATAEHGLTPPVLTDYLELTVGGTLSAGGIGGASHQHGPQVDHVLGLEVVTAAGEVVTCSPACRPEVFFGALAAHGGGGVITRATLPLVPAQRRARVYKMNCPSLRTLISCQHRLADERRFSYLEGQILVSESGGWGYLVEAAAFYSGEAPSEAALLHGLKFDPAAPEAEDMNYVAFCHRMVPGVRLLAATGDWYRPHPWLSVFLPSDTAERYVADALQALAPELLGPIPMLLYPLRRTPTPAPGLATPPADAGGLFYSFSILRTVDANPDMIGAALAHNDMLARAAVRIGGTVYPISTAGSRCVARC